MIFGVKILQTLHRNRTDVAANAAFTEHQWHPGFKTFDQTRFDLGMGVEVVVAAIGKGVQEFFHPAWTGLVNGFNPIGVQKKARPQILVQIGFTFHFGHAPHVGDVVVFNPHEVVFTLDVEHAKDGIRVGFARYVGDVPFVAGDGDALGLGFPSGNFSSAEGLTPGVGRDEE